jgi:hypothetical protein
LKSGRKQPMNDLTEFRVGRPEQDPIWRQEEETNSSMQVARGGKTVHEVMKNVKNNVW